MKFKVVGQEIACMEKSALISGWIPDSTADFELSDNWSGYVITAVFKTIFKVRAGSGFENKIIERSMSVTNGTCKIPWEIFNFDEPNIVDKRLYVGIFGSKDDVIIPSQLCFVDMIHDGCNTHPTDSLKYTPSELEQIRMELADTRENCTASAANVAQAAFCAAQSSTAAYESLEESKSTLKATQEAAIAAKSAAETAATAAAEETSAAIRANSSRTFAKVLTGTASGEMVTVDDADDAPALGITIYGKSAQNGTPTPDAPVAITNALEASGAKVVRCGKNIMDLYGFSTKSIRNATSTRYKTNDYGSEINTTDPENSVTVTNVVKNTSLPFSYTNGFMYIGFNFLVESNVAQRLSFDIDIISNPLNVARLFYFWGGGNTNATTNSINPLGKSKITIPVSPKDFVNAKNIEIRCCGANFTLSNFQIELGSTATAYTPCTAQTIPIISPDGGMPGIKLGATIPTALVGRSGIWFDGTDYWIGNWKDYGAGEYGVNIGKKVFDGTENWSKNSINNDGNYLFYQTNFAINNNGTYPQSPYCTHTPPSVTHPSINPGAYIAQTSSLFLNLGDVIGGGTPQYFKSYLAAQYAAGTPVTIYYITAAETITDIPAEELAEMRQLTTRTGDNNLMVAGSTVNPQLKINYARNLNLAYNKLSAAVVALGGII